MQQIVVRVPEQQKITFEQIAQQSGQSVSVLVREALDQYLKKSTKKNSGNLLLKLSQIGKDIDGPKNLSSSYKDYLYRGKN